MENRVIVDNNILYAFDYLVIAYLCASFLLSLFNFISAYFLALFLAIALFAIPYAFGICIIGIFPWRIRQSQAFRFLIGFFAGTVILNSAIVLFAWLGYKIDIDLVNTVISLMILLGICKDFVLRFKNGHTHFNWFSFGSFQKWKNFSPLPFVVFSCMVALVAFGITKAKLPFPMVSFDHAVGVESIQPVNRLINYGFLDVFKARTLPVILQAIVSSSFNVPIENLSWASPIATAIVFSLGIFFFVRGITKNSYVAAVGTLFGVFLCAGSGIFFDATFFIFRYSTIMATVFPLVLLEVFKLYGSIKEKGEPSRYLVVLFLLSFILLGSFYIFEFLKPSFLVSIFLANEFLKPFAISVFLLFIIIFMGKGNFSGLQKELFLFLSLFAVFAVTTDIFRPSIYLILVYFLLLVQYFSFSKQRKPFKILAESAGKSVSILEVKTSHGLNLLRLFGFLMITWLSLGFGGFLNNLTGRALILQPTWTIWVKASNMIYATSGWTILFYLVSCIFLLFSSNSYESIFAIFSLASLSIFLLPLSETFWVAYLLANVVMGFVLAVSCFKISSFAVSRIALLFPQIFEKNYVKRTLPQALSFLLVVSIIVPMFSSTVREYSYVPIGSDHRSILSEYEIETINDCISKLPEDTRIVSDPFTMRLFTSLTNRIWLVDHSDVPVLASNQSQQTIYQIWNNVFHSNSSQTAYSIIKDFNSTVPYDETYFIQKTRKTVDLTNYVIVISGRTAWWIDHNDPLESYTLFPHTYNVTVSCLLPFLNSQYFHLLYKIDRKMYVFAAGADDNNSVNKLISTDYLFKQPQVNFWNVEYYGTGNYSVTLSQINFTVDPTIDDNFLNITTAKGTNKIWVLYHIFDNATDFSKYDLLVLPFYGRATNRTFYLSLDGPTLADRTIFLFKEDFEGWNYLFFTLSSPTTNENNPDLGKIFRITFNPFLEDNYASGELYIGPIQLVKVLI